MLRVSVESVEGMGQWFRGTMQGHAHLLDNQLPMAGAQG